MGPDGRKTPMEPEGRGEAGGVKSRGRGRSMTDKGRAGGMTGHGGDEEALSQGGADGSEGRSEVQDSEAGGGDRGSSNPEVAGDWRSRSISDPPGLAS